MVVMSSTWLISSIPDALDEIFKRLRVPAGIEALEEILHHRAHLPELSAEALLKNVGSCGIRFVRGDRVDEVLNVEKHTPRIRASRSTWLVRTDCGTIARPDLISSLTKMRNCVQAGAQALEKRFSLREAHVGRPGFPAPLPD